jgi:uncharacterized membrane protein
MSNTDNDFKTMIMAETAQHLVEMIQKRVASRLSALNALQSPPLDNIPDEVKKMREIEAGKIRAVMQEQTDLIEIIQMLFPKTTAEAPVVEKKRTPRAK